MMIARRIPAIAAAVAATLVLAGCTAAAHPDVVPAPTFAPRPEARPVDPIAQYATDRLSTMSLRQKVLSMLMVHVPGESPAERVSSALDGVGGFILMGDNIPGSLGELKADTAALSSEAGLPVLVATDQEGGIVRRVPTDDAASALQLRSQAPDAAFEAFAQRGALLESVGVSVNFGIVADIASDSSSFIYERSFGATGADAGARVAEAVQGESMVLSTLKHFPGHGAAAGDSHSSIPTTSLSFADWEKTHAVPFEDGIEAGAPLVMFGHLKFTAVDEEPATFSTRWHEILRDDLGFDGIAITDDMGMLERSGVAEYSNQISNAVRAIEAGNTMLLYVGAVDTEGIVAAVTEAVDEGELDEALIDDAAGRLLELRRELSGETGRFVACLAQCSALVS
ncbi:beta-N-acetylhexosaminidase [Salinibacterium amurskyense]|uniref:Beta-N-acetylhexosaminidase n=1 Tax=Salinibacterium amurskyense TaxID=205941 RepID=A0A2M9D921_9MICO|nr:glycoside hydrolase family 3 N-terminal domain-containing protein [Salinibacterium amurskyense]PJJ82142.1 beta-N-acetylhexosaminidase [Salinibacterium amurskyense]RLQ81919.1 glycoside hydrolase family 3 protein [Salinibacterium amurskyense]GHD78013.1 beta-N-acetylhexosaminidase [Salinibacterium amurskyense]